MASDNHDEIREYLNNESEGKSNAGKKMFLNPVTGKFEIGRPGEHHANDIPEITAEDMRSFSGSAAR